MRIAYKSFLSALCIVLGGMLLVAPTAFAKTKPVMNMPVISCGTSTQVSINVMVCGGATTGAPAGFSLQWETLADFLINGWRDSEDPFLCAGSFSGNANLSRYNLGPGECVTVDIGEFLFDNGASTNCPGLLTCGTQYIFRSFAHANSTYNRSDFTGNLVCSTLPCGSEGTCTFTQGYWKTHNPLVCNSDPGSPLCIQWPVSDVTLGNVDYDISQLVAIFNQPAAGNGLISLAHQLIAAKLNIANGADSTDIAADVAAADALIGNMVVPPVGTDSLAPSVTSTLVTSLTNYNEGATGPGHCSDEQ
jgi:hypothetical protein